MQFYSCIPRIHSSKTKDCNTCWKEIHRSTCLHGRGTSVWEEPRRKRYAVLPYSQKACECPVSAHAHWSFHGAIQLPCCSSLVPSVFASILISHSRMFLGTTHTEGYMINLTSTWGTKIAAGGSGGAKSSCCTSISLKPVTRTVHGLSAHSSVRPSVLSQTVWFACMRAACGLEPSYLHAWTMWEQMVQWQPTESSWFQFSILPDFLREGFIFLTSIFALAFAWVSCMFVHMAGFSQGFFLQGFCKLYRQELLAKAFETKRTNGAVSGLLDRWPWLTIRCFGGWTMLGGLGLPRFSPLSCACLYLAVFPQAWLQQRSISLLSCSQTLMLIVWYEMGDEVQQRLEPDGSCFLIPANVPLSFFFLSPSLFM